MSSQESDFHLDDGDDLVKAFLEQEARTEVKQPRETGKRSRTRSCSPDDRVNPYSMGVLKVASVDKENKIKKPRVEKSPSIEFLEVKSVKQEDVKDEKPVIEPESVSLSSSPIVIIESPVSWPPSMKPASEAIKEAHATHRKYMASSSTSTSTSIHPKGVAQTHVEPGNGRPEPELVAIHHPLTMESSQTTLISRLEDFDEEMNPTKRGKAARVGKFRKKDEDEVVLRDDRGNLTEKGKRALDKKLLGSLGEEENAITNSDLYSRTQHIISAATGHQISNRGGAKYSISGKDYNSSRNHKLKQQFTAAAQPVEGEGGVAGSSGKQETFVVQSRIFAGCTMWLNGYSGKRITDMELKKLIAVHGGNISMSEGSRITHVLVSERISGTKAERFLRGATKAYTKNGKKKVVLVDWVLDSVKRGKKLGESAYNVIENEAQPTIISKFGFSSASPSRVRSDEKPVKPTAETISGKPIEVVELD